MKILILLLILFTGCSNSLVGRWHPIQEPSIQKEINVDMVFYDNGAMGYVYTNKDKEKTDVIGMWKLENNKLQLKGSGQDWEDIPFKWINNNNMEIMFAKYKRIK